MRRTRRSVTGRSQNGMERVPIEPLFIDGEGGGRGLPKVQGPEMVEPRVTRATTATAHARATCRRWEDRVQPGQRGRSQLRVTEGVGRGGDEAPPPGGAEGWGGGGGETSVRVGKRRAVPRRQRSCPGAPGAALLLGMSGSGMTSGERSWQWGSSYGVTRGVPPPGVGASARPGAM